jgi:RNA polymerase sigma-70 factor (ECF subfamily)
VAALRRAVGKICPRELASVREDLLQVALLRVLEMEKTGEQNRVRTASYLWRVAWSAVVDEVRRLRRRPTVSMEGEEPSCAPQPQLAVALRECLGLLAVEHRRAAVVLHLHGFSAGEAARMLGREVKQVQNATYRGLAELRRCLSSKGHAP